MKRDRRIEAKFLLIGGEAKEIKSPTLLSKFPEAKELFKDYDLIILGDVPNTYLGQKNLELIRKFVEEHRGGLIVIAGMRYLPSSYNDKESPLREMLPVEFVPHTFKSDLERPPQFRVQVSKAGRDELMLQLGDTDKQNKKIWKELEGIYWFYPVTTVVQGRPGAAGASESQNGRKADAADGAAQVRQGRGAVDGHRRNVALAVQRGRQVFWPVLVANRQLAWACRTCRGSSRSRCKWAWKGGERFMAGRA